MIWVITGSLTPGVEDGPSFLEKGDPIPHCHRVEVGRVGFQTL